MGLISLEGMQFYAYHGVYEEEQLTGNHYIVDIDIHTGLNAAASTDDIADTVNYETVYFICKSEMAKPKHLLETVGASIISRIKHQFDTVAAVEIKIKKLNPPLGGRVASASVQMEDSFSNQCGRCGAGFICHGDGSCWCKDIYVHPQTLASIQTQYNGCLCANCLQFFAG